MEVTYNYKLDDQTYSTPAPIGINMIPTIIQNNISKVDADLLV